MFEVPGQESKINPAILAALICLLRVDSEQVWKKLMKGQFSKAAREGVPVSLCLCIPSAWNVHPIPSPRSFLPVSCWAFRILTKSNLFREAFPHTRPQAKRSFLQFPGLIVQKPVPAGSHGIVATHHPPYLLHCELSRASSNVVFVSVTQPYKTPSFVKSRLIFSLSG